MNNVHKHARIVSVCIHRAVASLEEQLRRNKPVTNDSVLNAIIFFSREWRLLVGDVCLTRITLASVIVNASNMPELIKSSRYVNGTSVAILQ